MICLDHSISFILIKPDALNNKEIYTDLFKEISNKKLNILEEKMSILMRSRLSVFGHTLRLIVSVST